MIRAKADIGPASATAGTYPALLRFPPCSAWPSCSLSSPPSPDVTGPARVIDGDTIEVAGERIRVHGIDARMVAVGREAVAPAGPDGMMAAA